MNSQMKQSRNRSRKYARNAQRIADQLRSPVSNQEFQKRDQTRWELGETQHNECPQVSNGNRSSCQPHQGYYSTLRCTKGTETVVIKPLSHVPKGKTSALNLRNQKLLISTVISQYPWRLFPGTCAIKPHICSSHLC